MFVQKLFLQIYLGSYLNIRVCRQKINTVSNAAYHLVIREDAAIEIPMPRAISLSRVGSRGDVGCTMVPAKVRLRKRRREEIHQSEAGQRVSLRNERVSIVSIAHVEARVGTRESDESIEIPVCSLDHQRRFPPSLPSHCPASSLFTPRIQLSPVREYTYDRSVRSRSQATFPRPFCTRFFINRDKSHSI